MNIIKTWAQGLDLLEPKHMKLMMQVVQKSIKQTYWLTVSQLWYLFVPSLISVAIIESCPDSFTNYGYLGTLFFTITFFYLLGVAKSVRASVGIKDARYFREFSPLTWDRTSVLSKLSIVCFMLVSNIVMKSIVFLTAPYTKLPLFFLGLYTWVIAPLAVLWMLMYWEARPDWRRIFIAFWRAIKMIVFNYPLILAVYGLVIVGIWMLSWIIGLLGALIGCSIVWRLTLGIVLAPAIYAVWSTLFIKLWHDQIELYTS